MLVNIIHFRFYELTHMIRGTNVGSPNPQNSIITPFRKPRTQSSVTTTTRSPEFLNHNSNNHSKKSDPLVERPPRRGGAPSPRSLDPVSSRRSNSPSRSRVSELSRRLIPWIWSLEGALRWKKTAGCGRRAGNAVIVCVYVRTHRYCCVQRWMHSIVRIMSLSLTIPVSAFDSLIRYSLGNVMNCSYRHLWDTNID